MGLETDWLKQKSEHFQAHEQMWKDIMLCYDSNVRKLRDPKYLIRRKSGESWGQFQERLALADWPALFPIIVDTYVGRMLEAERRITRVWQDDAKRNGLGEISDKKSRAGQLWRNADGGGSNWLTLVEDAAVLFLTLKEFYALTQGVRRDANGKVIGDPYVRLIEPWAVHDVEYDGNKLVEAKVFHRFNRRKSVKQMNDFVDRYTIYTLDGTEVWEIAEKEGEEDRIVQQMTPYGMVGNKPFYYYADEERSLSNRILPIFRNVLPLRRNPGATLADKNLVVFNMDSERNNIVRTGNTAKAQFVGDRAKFVQLIQENDAGSNIWQLDPNATKDHKFIAPPMDSAKIATEVIQKKFEEFFLTAFRTYEDSVRGRVKTATEVESDAAGENGILNILATGLDEYENGAALRLEQIENPDKPERWGQFNCERKKDFKPLDEREETDKIVARYFPTSTTPVLTRDAEIALTKRVYTQDGLPIDEKAIEAEVDARRLESDARRDRTAIERDRARTLLDADSSEIEARKRAIESSLAE